MTTTTTVSDNISIVRNVYTALSNQDFDTFANLLDENVRFKIMEGLQSTDVVCYEGRDAVMTDFLPIIPANYKELNINAETFVTNGNDVCAIGTYQGTGNAGIDFTVRFCHWYTVKNGRVANFEQFVDSAIINKAIGKVLD